jgi:RND family efflux transporter MFP subunit
MPHHRAFSDEDLGPRRAPRAARPARWAVAVITLAAACTKPTPAPPRGVPVKVMPVARTAAGAGTRFSAQIVPATRVDVAFKLGGYVEAIAQVKGVDGRLRNLQEGDVVAAGAALASIRKTEAQQKVAEARAAVAQTYSIYREAKLDAARDAKLAASGSLAGASADMSRSRRDSAGAALEGARVKLAEARTALADTTVVAPITGVVVKRALEVGALVTPGALAFTIADVHEVKAVFGVPDLFLPQIALGAPQPVTTDAFPGVEFAGVVSRVAPSADQRSRVFEIDVTLPNVDDKLKAGMIASLSIGGREPPRAGGAEPAAPLPLVPLGAIVRPPSGKGFAVYVVDAKGGTTRVHAVEIQLGDYLGRVVPVTAGLSGAESVVVQGAGLLSDGEEVSVIP